MNSVLQCLFNTRELREYFINNHYQDDVNKDNPLGTGGKLAESFAKLMKRIWSGTESYIFPKSLILMKENKFSMWTQQDAQEFMMELLDSLHEDLNRVKSKPNTELPDMDGWDDKRAADECWRIQKLRNDSIIDDLVKGQLRSTLTCHVCGNVSVKFDEFSCLSVQLPKDEKVIHVTLFWKDPHQKPKKFLIRITANACVEELINELRKRTGVPDMCIRIFEMY